MTRRLVATFALVSSASLVCVLSGCSSNDTLPSSGAAAGTTGGPSPGGAGGGGGSSAGGGGGVGGGAGGSMAMSDPFWGDLSVACPADMPDPSAPPLLGRDCDPLDPIPAYPDHCAFPFPSNVYLVDDPSGKNPSGKSVRFGAKTLPKTLSKKPIDPALFYDRDGFSPGQGALAYLPGATKTGMVIETNIGDSIKPTSNSILLNADTGELVPHWVDVDVSTTATVEDQRAVIVRPAVRLKDKTRYIVALRNVVDKQGNVIPPSPFFKALRDGTQDCAPQLTSLRKPLYDDIFQKLQAAGVDKSSLQIAWDYTTSSRESNTQDIVHMRDEALAKYTTFQYQITKMQPNMDGQNDLGLEVDVTVTLPLYLNTANKYDDTDPNLLVAPRLVRGDDGLPKQNGEFQWDVVILLPKGYDSAEPKKYGLLQNGHGLLGSRYEGVHGYLAQMANRHDYVAFATNFMGFCEDDVPLASTALTSTPANFISFVDRQTQGHLNQLLMMRFMKTTFLNDPLVQSKMGGSTIDPTLTFYRGDSQGGIMGTAYMSMSTDVTRGLLGEPGMSYNLLLNRSTDYGPYAILLGGSYPNALDDQVVLGAFQTVWDRSEPDGYAPYISQNMLPNTPPHNVLIHDAIGDCQVTPLGAHIIARAVGAKNLNPVNREIWGIDDADLIPAGGNGIVEYKFPLPVTPTDNKPPGAYCMSKSDLMGDPHDTVRKLDPSYDQSDHFFRTGEIKPYCNDTCSCGDATPEGGCPTQLRRGCRPPCLSLLFASVHAWRALPSTPPLHFQH